MNKNKKQLGIEQRVIIRSDNYSTVYNEAISVDFTWAPELEEVMDNYPYCRYQSKYRTWLVPMEKAADFVSKLGWERVEIDPKLKERIIVVAGKQIINMLQMPDYVPKREMFPHQLEALTVGINRDRLLLADAQGLGKTKEALDICEAEYQGECVKILIICSKTLIDIWRDAISTDTDQTYHIVYGPGKKGKVKEWLDDKTARYCIITYEGIADTDVTDMLDGNVNVAICDEVHNCKNPDSKRGRALQRIHAEKKIAISGTPIANKSIDLYNILLWLDVIPAGIKRFYDRYIKRIDSHQRLNKLLKEVMLRRGKDILHLPPKTCETVYVTMPPKMRKQHEDAVHNMLTVLDEKLNTATFLIEMLRLREITDGLYVAKSYDVKLKKIKKIVKEYIDRGEKVVIVSNWLKVVEKYALEFADCNPTIITGSVPVAERHIAVSDFQTKPECKMVIGTYNTMGTGLTMTAASAMILVDKPWTPALVSQAEDRIHRIGTTHPVKIISVSAYDSGDMVMDGRLAGKYNSIHEIVEKGRNLKLSRKDILEMLAQLNHTTATEIEKKLRKAG